MSDDKKSSSSIIENGKVFNGEIFVNNNSNDIDFDANNNSLRKSTGNSIGGSLSNNIRGSMKSNQSNGERFLTNSLMQDLRGSSKKFSDKKLEFDKMKLKDLQNQLNNTQLSNNSNSNNNEDDFLANIKLPKNDNNNQQKQLDDCDLYEDVENEDNEDNYYEMEEIENNNVINNNKIEEMNDIININKLTKFNEIFNKNRKNIRKNNESKGNDSDEPISLRSSGGSACNSSHSNNSNGIFSININMRSSKIFNKKEKNSLDKQVEKNSSGNLININEENEKMKNDNNNNNNNENNNIDNNITTENSENEENKKEQKETKENKEEKERKEKIAKIKDKNNEQNFISKKTINIENKNINKISREDKIELEMQLFNFDSFHSEKEDEKVNENIENDTNGIQNLQNIFPIFDNSKPNEIIKIIDNQKNNKMIENFKTLEKENMLEKEKQQIHTQEIFDEQIHEKKEEQLQEKEKNKELEKIKDIEKEKEEKIHKELNEIEVMGKEDYVFEKFGKLGWECEKCNNFNFESRTICNRCEAPKQPKSLQQIKMENELKSVEKKKKPLIERKGDWQCPMCHNLNFSFRVTCNRCKLPKEIYLKYSMKQKMINDNLNKNLNNINLQNKYAPQIPTTQIINNTAPQLIQNQFNIIQCGYMPMYNPYYPQNPYNQMPQQTNNNINNYKRKYKFYNQ